MRCLRVTVDIPENTLRDFLYNRIHSLVDTVATIRRNRFLQALSGSPGEAAKLMTVPEINEMLTMLREWREGLFDLDHRIAEVETILEGYGARLTEEATQDEQAPLPGVDSETSEGQLENNSVDDETVS